MKTISRQLEFRPEFPSISNVFGSLDYREFKDSLIKIDEILEKTGLEEKLISEMITQKIDSEALDPKKFIGTKQSTFLYNHLQHALRCNIARHLTGESYRAFSFRLTDSTLFQWFTRINLFGLRKATSKSSLDRYEKLFDEERIGNLIRSWLCQLSDKAQAREIGLNQSISFEDIFMDSTCVKAHIHFPVDWILLRDAARTLLLAIAQIRKYGLKNRIKEPSALLKEMNKLCIKMTQTRRKVKGKKQRKSILRGMKVLVKKIEWHARRYRKILENRWQETNLTQPQVNCVLSKMNNILEQLPKAIKQAHERIIGERQLASADKILSLYDKDAEIIIRGKVEGEIEFGQRLLLAEQRNGLIVDWKLHADEKSGDNKTLKPAVERIEKYFGPLGSLTTDSGFCSDENKDFLNSKKIYNAIKPKSPYQLRQRLEEKNFIELQTRRSQTEARIGIFKNVFLGRPLRSRITQYKRQAISWCVLTHNLWVLARKALADELSLSEFKQAA